MKEVERIADQLKRAHEGGAWHGPAIDELLKGVTAGQAAARPFEGAHSIRELVAHVEAWERAILRRLGGDPAQIYQTEEDWSSADVSGEEAWDAARRKLTETYVALREAVLQLDDAQLDEPILPNMSTRYVSLHGAVQHTLYHAGQIALVRKALGLKSLTVDSDTAGTI
ncbi:MAG: DinB family protein [Acidobacteria bacterium]|nr:DinB family protein [Acidobacteriota bacterium]